ncbi:uncharacterized protein LOC112595266 [Melanaphis sacchari]|uniref:uncharacterized protein LOC112595266 n=1 Tax=Melanaphis sacchari TaxID=742174 RepID=UPI000DC1452E|nr:uncharacterized protein LOC112595266 [Melanaphis sacchari]
MTTTESLTTVAKQNETWDNFFSKFVKRPIFLVPFVKSSTQSSAIQISSKRVQRNALPYNSGGNGGRGTIMSYSSKDRNGLRQPIVIDNMQIRRRRSVSNVKSSSKTDVIVLAGSNPFALILANRVHNNTTGSIKPLGLWEQIKRLF